jgi:hypothetical protein
VRWNDATGAWSLVKIEPEQNEEAEVEPSTSEAENLQRDFAVEQSFARKRIDSMIKGTDRFTSNLAKRAKDLLPHYSKLSDEQLGSLSLYTSDFYEPVNNHLRGRQSNDFSPEEQKFYAERAKDMVSALTKVPNAKEQTYYRGMSGDIKSSRTQQTYARLKPGDVISDRSFSSFSTNPEEAQKFLDPELSSTYIILNSSKLKQIDFLSQSPEEEEHLAMPNEQFRVKKNEIVNDKSMGKVRIVELEDIK